jgi:cytoskeleton protein RodZ
MTKPSQKTDTDPSAKPPTKGDQESFGTWLKRERETREISLREIADASKISIRYLQALEDERFEVLPAAVFAKGFLRQYARYVGLEPEEAVNFFLAASQDDEEGPDESQPPQRRASGLPWVALVIAASLVLVAWALTRLDNKVPGEDEDVLPPPAIVAPAAQAVATPTPPPSAVEDAAPLVVTLDFRGECWVEVAVDGEPQVAGEVRVQGESLRFEGQELVKIKVGNITVVDVEVNGTPYTPKKTSSTVREILIDLAMAQSMTNQSMANPEGSG